MRFVSVRDLRGRSAEVWDELSREKELVITSNGKPIAILSSTSEKTLEQSLHSLRKVRAIEAVKAIQLKSKESQKDHLSLDEINAEIKQVRKARQR